MEGAEAEGDRVVVVRFTPNRARSAPLTAANLPILSKAYYSTHAFDETSMEPPLGSGPYKVGKFEQGRFVEFERVKDWWGANLPITKRAVQFRRAAVRLLPRPRHCVRRLHVQELHVPRGVHLARLGDTLRLPRAQGRPRQAREHSGRPAFRPAGVDDEHAAPACSRTFAFAQALSFAFDFEWANKNLMFDAYARTQSCFQNSEMMAKGKPSREELALLEPSQGQAAGRRFRRSLEFAGQRRLRPGPPTVAAVGGIAQHRRLDRQGRQARQRQGRAIRRRVPGVRAGVGAAPRALHQEPRRARHRGHDARGGSGAVPRPHAGLRLRRLDEPDRRCR